MREQTCLIGAFGNETRWAIAPLEQSFSGRLLKDDRFRVGWLNGLGDAARVEDAQGTPTQRHISPSILVHEENACPRTMPRKALRGGISKSILQRPCQFWAKNVHKMAPKTT